MTTSNQTQDATATASIETTTQSTNSPQQHDTTSTSTNTTEPQPQSQSQSNPSTPKKTILIINGPNLNLLGYREPSIYGNTKLADIESHLSSLATKHGINIQTFQSNHEGAIVDRLHEAFWANLAVKNGESSTATTSTSTTGNGTVDGVIINPGAYTHTSVALRDALVGTSLPFVECHISNVHAREAFRHKSFLSDKAEAVIAGLGVFGYVAALEWWCWRWSGGRLEDAGM